MSFSKAKLKRFNDIDVACGSPSTAKLDAATSGTPTAAATAAAAAPPPASSSAAQPERKEQIEKFFKDAVRFASSTKESKDSFAAPKEDKKSKGLRLFRTPSLPHRLRFRQNSEAASNNNNNNGNGSAPLSHSASSTPVKDGALAKSAGRLKGKEALQHELRIKSEQLDSCTSQIEVLKRHVEQLKLAEAQLRTDHASITTKTDTLIHELTAENQAHKQLNDELSAEKAQLAETCARLEAELSSVRTQHDAAVAAFGQRNDELKSANDQLEQKNAEQSLELDIVRQRADNVQQEAAELREKVKQAEQAAHRSNELLKNLQNTNDALSKDLSELQKQLQQDALAYAQETKAAQTEMECLKKERSTLKHDLANKCDLIRSLQEELLDKSCEIDAHCDSIRKLCGEKAQYMERERLMEAAEQKVQRLETELQTAVEREQSYWRAELEKRQKLAENEAIKIELEKQDVMVLLESTNDMLRERDDKLHKCEEQLRNGIDYYVQLTDSLQKQVVDLKQDVAKTITEKYNYQLTLSNTRSTVNILMERLKKSDADVEQLKAQLESERLAKAALEQNFLALQQEMQAQQQALQQLQASAKTLQDEVSMKENICKQMLTSEEDTLSKFNKIASSFQERIDANADAARYVDMYHELRRKDEQRELYMQEMKKALDDFSHVLQFAQIELDSKDSLLLQLREEADQLKLDNISLKSKVDEGAAKRGNSTDLEKIEDLLIDSELRSECEKITSWLLGSSEKQQSRAAAANEFDIGESLNPATPNSGKTPGRACTTPVRTPRTPRTPHTPKTSHTPRTTPKKTVLFPGKENVPSPQKQVLKARNV